MSKGMQVTGEVISFDNKADTTAVCHVPKGCWTDTWTKSDCTCRVCMADKSLNRCLCAAGCIPYQRFNAWAALIEFVSH